MKWTIIGEHGFVGSALMAHLTVLGEDVAGCSAPRLSASDEDSAELSTLAAHHSATQLLAEFLRGSSVVVLAAGLAAPDAPWTDVLVGANGLLPPVAASAAELAGVSRFIHLSTAAVQGRTPVLDESDITRPFSPYSRSKAVGEKSLALLRRKLAVEIVIVRATSVQGSGRATTLALRRFARSGLASVAGTGARPSPASSVEGLCAFISTVGMWTEPLPGILVQPWEGLSAAEVLRGAGGREPKHLPVWLCRAAIELGYAMGAVTKGRLAGPVRRAEAMWFGQEVNDAWSRANGIPARGNLEAVLATA